MTIIFSTPIHVESNQITTLSKGIRHILLKENDMTNEEQYTDLI